jgi:pheromone alpha factor receptor
MESFDPYTQNITLKRPDGSDIVIPLLELDNFAKYNSVISVNYGVQLGASIIVLLLVGLLTAPEKRRTIIFALNTVSLMCSVARMVCMTSYFSSEFNEIYTLFSGDYSRVPLRAYVGSIFGVWATTLLIVCVELSLLVQTHAICSTVRARYRRAVVSFSTVVALTPIAIRFWMSVENSKAIAKAVDFGPFIWLQNATNISVTVSICYFSAFFVAKLGYAIRSRKKLGMTGFGAMQVIFIMSCQSMIVPGKRTRRDKLKVQC